MTIKPPPGRVFVLIGKFFSKSWLEWFDTFRKEWNTFYATVTGLTASLLVSTDASGDLSSVDDLTDWFTATSGITLTDNGDGTMGIGQNSPSQGNLTCYNVADALNTVAVDTWYQITSFTTQGNLTVSVTVSVAESHIEIGSSGTQCFLSWFSGALHCAAAHSFELMLKKNNGATALTSVVAEVSTPAATPYNISAQNVIALNAEDTLELWIKRTTAGDNITVTIDNMTMGVLESANF